MNTSTSLTRINITFPTDLLITLRKMLPKRGLSDFLAETAREKVEETSRKKALRELLDAPPTFKFLKGKNASVNWVRSLRREDEKRLKRIFKN
jgi:hypothetical protein